jgi:hypothetical protein
MLSRTARSSVVCGFVMILAQRDARPDSPVPKTSADDDGRTGVLCLRKLPGPQAFIDEGKGASIPGQEPPARKGEAKAPRLLITVDREPAIGVDQRRGGCIDHLLLSKRHLVRLSRDGHSSEVARFGFADDKPGTTVLELRYDPFYSHGHIEPLRRQPGPTEVASCAICPDVPKMTDAWPRDVLIRGTRPHLDLVQMVPGVDVEDHGQRKVSDDQWELSARISTAGALTAVRKINVTITMLPEPGDGGQP